MRWEYWPPFVFYGPVVLYVLWLGIRHRGEELPDVAKRLLDPRHPILARYQPLRIYERRCADPCECRKGQREGCECSFFDGGFHPRADLERIL